MLGEGVDAATLVAALRAGPPRSTVLYVYSRAHLLTRASEPADIGVNPKIHDQGIGLNGSVTNGIVAVSIPLPCSTV